MKKMNIVKIPIISLSQLSVSFRCSSAIHRITNALLEIYSILTICWRKFSPHTIFITLRRAPTTSPFLFSSQSCRPSPQSEH